MLCREGFEVARHIDERYVRVPSADEYYFPPISGLQTLEGVRSVEHPRILDIGAGSGAFLADAADSLEAQGIQGSLFGITAMEAGRLSRAAITWVFGDFLRPDTWRPKAPETESIDVAVSHLTFLHFADPLRGLKIALGLLKPGGELFVDDLVLQLKARNAEAAAAKYDQFLRSIGEYDSQELTDGSVVALRVKGLHAIKGSVAVHPNLYLCGDHNGKAVYSTKC